MKNEGQLKLKHPTKRNTR